MNSCHPLASQWAPGTSRSLSLKTIPELRSPNRQSELQRFQVAQSQSTSKIATKIASKSVERRVEIAVTRIAAISIDPSGLDLKSLAIFGFVKTPLSVNHGFA